MEKLFRLVASLIISLTTVNAFAQPTGVGPAEVLPGYCLFTVVIDTGDYITIANILDVEDNQLVLTYSNKGNANLNCSGKLDRTAPVVGTDLLVNPGAPVEGMLIPPDEACAFVESLGFDTCKGNGGASISNYEITGSTCNLPVDGGYRASTDWRQLTAPSGRVKLYCHWNSNKDTFVPVP